MKDTNIDCFDHTWNPVWGCAVDTPCWEYCKSREIARRCARQIAVREHTYLKNRGELKENYDSILKKIKSYSTVMRLYSCKPPLTKKPSNILVGMMSEIYFWELSWIQMVFDEASKNPHNNYILQTSFPHVYAVYMPGDIPNNIVFGITATTNDKIRDANDFVLEYRLYNDPDGTVRFMLAIEPIQEAIIEGLDLYDWVIVGVVTGNFKRFEVKKEWIINLQYKVSNKQKLFIRDSVNKYLFNKDEHDFRKETLDVIEIVQGDD
jgi:protein gp37